MIGQYLFWLWSISMKKLVFCCSMLSFDSILRRRLSISNSSRRPAAVKKKQKSNETRRITEYVTAGTVRWQGTAASYGARRSSSGGPAGGVHDVIFSFQPHALVSFIATALLSQYFEVCLLIVFACFLLVFCFQPVLLHFLLFLDKIYKQTKIG